MAPDAHFEHPRLASIYDVLDPDRSDLNAYVALADQLGARSVLDIGCGTGVLALQLAARGLQVVGLDPAGGSLAVAAAKPGAQQVRWVHGDAYVLDDLDPPVVVDLVVMTGNVAQAITDTADWAATLRAVHDALVPGGHLVFETRAPQARGWQEWTKEATDRRSDLPGVGQVRDWVQVTSVTGPPEAPVVTFTSTFLFVSDGARLESHSVLVFRSRQQVEADLAAAGLQVVEVRGAPDRPGLEMVFVATRPEPTATSTT